jgi:pimeloyl-ACP methyl ester carboxylesterase
VHSGFINAYEELQEQLYKYLAELNCSHVAVTGHSLGGAIATVAALDIRVSGFQVNPVFTFGSPRVGNPEFVEAYVKASRAQSVEPPQWRVVHFHDPVARLPPPSAAEVIGLNYSHMGREVYYSQNSDSYQVCEDVADDPQCSSSVSLLGCLNKDHILYFNLTFAHKELPESCVGPPRNHFEALRLAWHRVRTAQNVFQESKRRKRQRVDAPDDNGIEMMHMSQ